MFTLLAFDALHGRPEAAELVEISTWTIVLSVLTHGLTSGPLAARYGRSLADAPPDTPELAVVPTTRVRRRTL